MRTSRVVLVCGAGGFIGHHLVRRLRSRGDYVVAVDQKLPLYSRSDANEFIRGDLCDPAFVRDAIDRRFDEVYQLAADMGGAGYVFTGEHDIDIMSNSVTINVNILHALHRTGSPRVFYSSSACIYPAHNQSDPANPRCDEASAYPAAPDSEYGWEKLFSERLYLSAARNYGLEVRIARYHNIFGPEGSWNDGREKAPAAICRKVAMAADGGEVEIWGDGRQTRSFLYIEECLEGTLRLMQSNVHGAVNIGSEEIVSIGGLVDLVAAIARKRVRKRYVDGPVGVQGRNSDNRRIREVLHWAPSGALRSGLETTYAWTAAQVHGARAGGFAVASR